MIIENNPTLKLPQQGLHFLSLGGIGEIGANCYLYCCDSKWIMIDLGLAFAEAIAIYSFLMALIIIFVA